MAKVKIENLRLRTIIGTFDIERGEKQDIITNIEFSYDSKKAAETDDLTYAVDYKAMIDKIQDDVEDSHFFLLEKLADHIMSIIKTFDTVYDVTVKVGKPDAIRFADCISVELKG